MAILEIFDSLKVWILNDELFKILIFEFKESIWSLGERQIDQTHKLRIFVEVYNIFERIIEEIEHS